MDVEPLGYVLLHCFQITGQRKYGLIVKKKYGCFFLFFLVSFSGNNLFMYIIYCLKLQAYLGGVLRGFLYFWAWGGGFWGGWREVIVVIANSVLLLVLLQAKMELM